MTRAARGSFAAEAAEDRRGTQTERKSARPAAHPEVFFLPEKTAILCVLRVLCVEILVFGSCRHACEIVLSLFTAYPKTAWEKGTVPFCSADYAKSGQSPAVFG